MHSKRGGGEGTVTFCLANLLRRSYTELLLCVCWLDKVVLLVHCCALHISCIQGTLPYPVSCRLLQCFAISAMDVDDIDTYPAGAAVNFPTFWGQCCACQDCACHRGWSPLPSPLPGLLPKLPNLVPNLQPRVQPNRQPSLQLKSPFLWPLLSIRSSSGSNTPVRKSATQSLFPSRAEHAPQQAIPGSFCGSYALVPARLVSCRASFA